MEKVRVARRDTGSCIAMGDDRAPEGHGGGIKVCALRVIEERPESSRKRLGELI